MKRRRTVAKAAVALLAAFVAVDAAAGEIILAERGAPPECPIRIANDADECVRYAAQELRDHVKQMTDVSLPIVADVASASLPKKAIVLEVGGAAPNGPQSRLDAEAFRLHVDGERLRITGGGPRGVLYGVYELLETYGGAGWFSSWRTVVPKRERFTVPDILDDSQRPAFAMRKTSWFDALNPEFAARLRLNGDWNIPAGPKGGKFGGAPFRFGRGLPACHTFKDLLPPEKHFREHPEWFSEVNGHRKGAPTQLCLTNPDVLRLVTSNVLEHIRRDPDATFYGVSQNDWGYYCTCPRCAAVDKEEGGHAGTIIRFVNAIAGEVEKEFPHAIVETLAYQWSRKPPLKTRPRRNVAICLCTIECGFGRPLAEGGDEANDAFVRDMRGWAAMTDNLYLWDYVTNFRHYPHLLPNVHSLGPNLRFFRDNGAKFMYEQADSKGRHADFAELKAWLLGKFMWNPDQPLDPLLDRFFEGYYGAAAPFARQYFEEAQALGRAPGVGHWGIYSEASHPNVPDGFLSRATNLWARAAAAVADDPDLSYNVRMGAMSPLYTIAMRSPAACIAWVTRDPARSDAATARRIVSELLDCQRASGDRIRWAEWDGANNARVDGWRKFLKSRDAFVPADKATIGVDILGAGFGKRGRIVKDAAAMEGRALELFPNHFERCVRCEFGRIGFDAGAKYRLRIHLRVAKKPEGSGEAFWTGVYDSGRGRVILERPYNVADVPDDGYQWYDILEWEPSPDHYFWLGPGRFDQGRHETSPAHNGVFIDAVEITRQ